MNQTNNGKGNKAGMGVGIAAATAAAALGAYFLYGSKNAAKNRRAVKGWMVKAKGEVMERLENMDEVTEKTYHDVVNKVISGYKGAKGITATEVASLAIDLKKHWNALKPLVKKAKKGGSSGKKSGGSKVRRSSGGSKAGAKTTQNGK